MALDVIIWKNKGKMRENKNTKEHQCLAFINELVIIAGRSNLYKLKSISKNTIAKRTVVQCRKAFAYSGFKYIENVKEKKINAKIAKETWKFGMLKTDKMQIQFKERIQLYDPQSHMHVKLGYWDIRWKRNWIMGNENIKDNL